MKVSVLPEFKNMQEKVRDRVTNDRFNGPVYIKSHVSDVERGEWMGFCI
jgi:hypothetical protein